ncbi:hypothetical protein PI124_g17670 [Phytophthora idaei]|nr:hypothetical protein PI125_g7547 [Phytophthora idaei]KAG3237340.1 hypothetical protein PI124_g17670 [Phytophthora idaei]
MGRSTKSKRTREYSNEVGVEDKKRVCTAKHDNDGFCTQYERFKHIKFPAAISALPHIMKHIDLLLMTMDEAAIEAATTGDWDWMDELLARHDCFDDIEAITRPAVANDHLDVVQLLMPAFFGYHGEMDIYNWGDVLKMAAVAAENGHIDVVKYLLPKEIDSYLGNSASSLIGALQRVFEEAAANGHVDVVKLMVERNCEGLRYLRSKKGCTIACDIRTAARDGGFLAGS